MRYAFISSPLSPDLALFRFRNVDPDHYSIDSRYHQRFSPASDRCLRDRRFHFVTKTEYGFLDTTCSSDSPRLLTSPTVSEQPGVLGTPKLERNENNATTYIHTIKPGRGLFPLCSICFGSRRNADGLRRINLRATGLFRQRARTTRTCNDRC